MTKPVNVIVDPGDYFAVTRALIRMVCDELIDKLWRLEGDAQGRWVLEYIGSTPADPPTILQFESNEDMPMWVRRRVAVLSMLDEDPYTSIVWGVGRRISERVYWVVEPRGGGDDDQDT